MENEMQDQQGDAKDNLLEAAWGLIANANEGNWDSALPEWQEAAVRWRDAYFATLPRTENPNLAEAPDVPSE